MTLTSRPRFRQFPRAARLKRWGAAAVVMTATCALLPAQAASAAIDSTTCTGTSQVTFTPGVTFTPQNITVDENDSAPSCTSTDPTITGTIMRPYSYPVTGAACNDVELMPGPMGVRWNNGQHSFASSLTFELTSTAGIVQETGTGTITSGEFTGATAVFTWIYPLVNPLLCLTPGGVTGQNGTLLIQITGV